MAEENKPFKPTLLKDLPQAHRDSYGNVENAVQFHSDKLVAGTLTLKDGTVIHGYSFGAEVSAAGETVFNTGMVGYPESLTDPSYRGQILCITYPLIGNYGVPASEEDEFGLPKFFESDKIHVRGLIVCDYSFDHSHHQANRSLSQWLKEHNIPALYSVDTRELTKKLREDGSILGKIEFSEKIEFDDPNTRNLVAEVSRKEVWEYGHKDPSKTKIIAVDCGIKNNIIRYLCKQGVYLKVVPWDYDFTDEAMDGLFMSNGPGDPEMVKTTIENIRKVMNTREDLPIFGICLGHQLLALAAGCKTYKMKFGNRGMNQPCIDLRNLRCYITPQNHGYAVDAKSLPEDWLPFFRNANDHSNEGIIHKWRPLFSVQFHPEAQGGPTDTEFLFDMFLQKITSKRSYVTTLSPPMLEDVSTVLILGSGGLSIGQAGEFDYSGSQAIKALREKGIKSILINPNIATVQTSARMADDVYFLPVTPEYVKGVIEKVRPDGVLLQFGGQTALNCGIELEKSGVFEEFGVRVLGTPVATIEMTEDREAFANKLKEVNEKVAPSFHATTVEDAMLAAEKIGYPVLVRSAFALGGLGSGFASNPKEMKDLAEKAFVRSSQIMIDKSLRGWKEVEYEVVRDCQDNCITVCNMENFDPLGIHTGDSIVIAPSQTLTNREYYLLRRAAIKIIRHLGVVGECNIQYALNPESDEYFVIEVNARLSRSSALASKATGYPLAYVAAKLALGIPLTSIKNSVTKKTCACFEPALDYVVVKFPRWDMRKFWRVSKDIGSQMKSVGEVMAIDRNFEACFNKAMRMVDDSVDGFGQVPDKYPKMKLEELERRLSKPSDRRVFAIAEAFRRNWTVERIWELTKIDRWFLCKLRNIVVMEKLLMIGPELPMITRESMFNAKRIGLSDKQIGRVLGNTELEVRTKRKSLGVVPVVKQIDTLAAEFPAATNYLYMTYSGKHHDLTFDDHGTMVLGCGAYRIGSSCEFDWCAVSAIRTLRDMGVKSIVVNYNPETVSTDYDECDRLYFEELSFERVLDIYECEQSAGVIVSVGGQIPNNLAIPLKENGAKILGTQPDSIDRCENRHRFSQLMDSLDIDQPQWSELSTVDDAIEFSKKVGYPVLIRPSYVLSGAAMNVAFNEKNLIDYLNSAVGMKSASIVVTKFILNAKEIEFDAVAQNGEIINYAISEHIENAGVHSGDATLVLPAQNLYVETIKRIRKISKKIAKGLNITGPFNVQYLSKNNDIKVIECNLRSSRSFPFVSKTFNINFIDLATRAMVQPEQKVKRVDFNLMDIEYVCVKAPMFSFSRLQGADPVLRVEMASTGEVACFGGTRYEAFMKSLMSAGFRMPKTKSVLLSLGPLNAKVRFLESVTRLQQLGYSLYATSGTSMFLEQHGIYSTMLQKPSGTGKPRVLDFISMKKIGLAIVIPDSMQNAESDGYKIRRHAVDFGVPLIVNLQQANLLTRCLAKAKEEHDFKLITSWRDYLSAGNRLGLESV